MTARTPTPTPVPGFCLYPSDDPATAEDWYVCYLSPGHEGDHEARLMWWPTRPEDRRGQ